MSSKKGSVKEGQQGETEAKVVQGISKMSHQLRNHLNFGKRIMMRCGYIFKKIG